MSTSEALKPPAAVHGPPESQEPCGTFGSDETTGATSTAASRGEARRLPRGGVLWALVDCNNFYASCERLFRPDLKGRPVVVLSNNDGCVIARSAEAKALGVPMGAPEFKVRDMLRAHDVAVFSSNYALYGDISQRVMRTLATVVPRVEVYSIDEAFIPLPAALAADPVAVGRTLRQRVAQWVGIPVSVGVGPTRTLAKLANRLSKQDSAYGNVFDLTPETVDMDRVLASVDVGDVWGVGHRSVEMLRGRGILTARALRDADPLWVRQRLTVTGWRTQQELRGMPCLADDDLPVPRRSIRSSRSFGHMVRTMAPLREAVATFTARAVAKARAEGLVASCIEVHIRTPRHTERPRYDETTTITLPCPTADTGLCIRHALTGLERIFREGYLYAKAGVTLFGLEPAAGRQGSLLDLLDGSHEHKARRERLMAALDAVNLRHGRGSIRHGAEGDPGAAWHMSQKYRSPRYTTAWEELPEVLCR